MTLANKYKVGALITHWLLENFIDHSRDSHVSD